MFEQQPHLKRVMKVGAAFYKNKTSLCYQTVELMTGKAFGDVEIVEGIIQDVF